MRPTAFARTRSGCWQAAAGASTTSIIRKARYTIGDRTLFLPLQKKKRLSRCRRGFFCAVFCPVVFESLDHHRFAARISDLKTASSCVTSRARVLLIPVSGWFIFREAGYMKHFKRLQRIISSGRRSVAMCMRVFVCVAREGFEWVGVARCVDAFTGIESFPRKRSRKTVQNISHFLAPRVQCRGWLAGSMPVLVAG